MSLRNSDSEESRSSISILRGSERRDLVPDGGQAISAAELRTWIRRGTILKHLFAYREARVITDYLENMTSPFTTALLLRLLSRGRCVFADAQGKSREITLPGLVGLAGRCVGDIFTRPWLISRTRRTVRRLAKTDGQKHPPVRLDLAANPLYLRTDLWLGVRSGGSVGHIAGVLNNLGAFAGAPVFLTTDRIPTVDPAIDSQILTLGRSYWDWDPVELPSLHFNEVLRRSAAARLENISIAFVYQRYSLNNFSGLRLARAAGVPFILEYNGSEVWISRHWGNPLKYESLSAEIEMLNLKGADVIVVVSRPMYDELVGRGIDGARILVNPNGVDPQRYSPQISGTAVRARHRLEGKTVVGFIGTFGRWHGAEVLTEAFGRLLTRTPEHRQCLRLLMIGDGQTMPQVKEAIARHGIDREVVLTGLVPQEEGPEHLAACDILVAPHIPNPDGTPFFGSPTKLFEYMAMAKGIVASDLDQIGEVLNHERTALLVRPGDVDDLAAGILRLADDASLREALGQAAREEVMSRYTWREHTRRIIEKLQERCRA